MALVMFDYDGTITDSLELCASAFIEACRENGFNAIKNKDDFLKLLEENIYENMEKMGLDIPEIDQIMDTYKGIQGQRLSTVKFIPGIAEVIRKMAVKHKVFVITSNIAQTVREVLKEREIEGVEDVFGLENDKSKIKKIKLALDAYPELEPFYIGDTTGDIIEGREAGVKTVGVTWGFHSRDKMLGESPDYLVDAPDDLCVIINK